MRQLLLALPVAVGIAGPTAADDRVLGRWVLDEAAFRAQVEGFYTAAIAEVPAEEQEQAEAFVDQAVEATVERMAGSSATFEADGTVTLEPAEGRPQTSNWSREGDTIVLEPAVDAAEAATLVGTFEEDRLRLTPDEGDGVGFVMRRATE
ncbi:MAG: hypothetical protein ACLFU0_10875 [Alphaproteobacteria bacterium]